MFTELNIVGREKGSFNSMLGEAHQHIIIGWLLRLGFNVAAIPVRGGAYDLVVTGYPDRANKPLEEKLLRAQARTIHPNLKLIAGLRGGIDRKFIRPSPKEYKYTERHNDLLIGIDRDSLDFYVVPTRFINKWGKSVGKTKLAPLRNNFDILLNWRDDYLAKLEATLL